MRYVVAILIILAACSPAPDTPREGTQQPELNTSPSENTTAPMNPVRNTSTNASDTAGEDNVTETQPRGSMVSFWLATNGGVKRASLHEGSVETYVMQGRNYTVDMRLVADRGPKVYVAVKGQTFVLEPDEAGYLPTEEFIYIQEVLVR